MIRICFVTTISLTLKAFLLDTAKYLHDTGEFDIYMVCNPDESFEISLPDYITFLPVKMKRGFGLDGLKVIKKLKNIFKEYKFDIVQYSTPNASCYASIAAKKAMIPVRLYCQWGIAYVGYTGIKRKLLKAIEKHTCKCSTWIEPDSKSNLDFAHKERLYPSCIGSVVWNGSACGVDLKKFDYSKRLQFRNSIRTKYNISQKSFVFGFVGRITKDKGINELLTAFKQLSDDSYLIIVGQEEKKTTINKSLYAWSKNEKRIIYAGYSNEVEKYLSSFDCFVLPSYREGFGLGIVESEAMGTPVIVTNIPGPIDAMEDNKTGYIVKKKDTLTLLDAMKKMIGNKNRFVFEQECVKYAKNYFDSEVFLKHLYLDRKELYEKSKKS